MKAQSGFTLIELVAVIIILAIMAATAMPRFMNMSGDARVAAVNGLAGSLKSTHEMIKSKWIIGNSANVNTINVGIGRNVSVVNMIQSSLTIDEYGDVYAGIAGIAGSKGIDIALDYDGFASGLEIPMTTTGAQTIAFWPTGAAQSTGCHVRYSSGVVTVSATALTCL